MNIKTETTQTKIQVIEKCWQYLLDNFHKFSDTNRIKISLALCTKDVPTQLEGKGLVGETKIIIVRENEKQDGKDVPVNSEAGRCLQLID